MNAGSSAAQPGTYTTVAWGGDVNLGRRFHYRFHEDGADAGLAAITPLREAALGIINLECVVATGGELGFNKNERASYYYRARPEMLKTLVDGGVDIVATANNHSGDYGPDALLEQARWLNAAGIAHAGSGANLDEALQPAIRRAGDLNVALFSLDATQASFAAAADRPGHAYLSLSAPSEWQGTLAPLIEATRQKADVILVAVHWGANNQAAPGRNEVAVGHAIIEAGADAVLGSSAHMLQGIEVYKDRPIIHDAGDLFFDAIRRGDKDSGVFLLEIARAGVRRVRFCPVEVNFCRSTLLQGEKAIAAVKRFSEKCAAFHTPLKLAPHGEGILELNPPTRAAVNIPAAPAAVYKKDVLRPLTVPKPDWVVDHVPEEARLESPVRIGPLELLGATLAPSVLNKRGLLFVESYWRLAEPTSEDWRIDFRAHPDKTVQIGSWGVSCDHDPCDWMWPTSRWQPGKIYRDHYSLRPQTVKHWQDTTLQLSISLKARDERTARTFLPLYSKFALAPEEAFAVLRAFPPRYKVLPREKLAKVPEQVWTAEQLQQVTGGKWLTPPPPGWYVSSISHKSAMILSDEYSRPRVYVATNKRIVARHELYSNLSGKDWDSHHRLPSMQQHIDGAIVAHVVDGLAPSFPVLQVEDPMGALMELGATSRDRLQGHVVAVTGSAGKTSLAGMLGQAMAVDKIVQTNATTNYNSRCGILHLLANTPAATDLVVMEVAVSAINAPGFQNIKLARPDIAVITNIAPSHLPPGKRLGYVAERKANIFEGMAENGWAVIYRETEYFNYLVGRARRQGLNVLTYGSSEDASFQLERYDPRSLSLQVRMPDGKKLEYSLRAGGLHTALNSLACIAVRKILDYEIEPFLPSLGLFEPAAGRGKIHEVLYKGQSITVVDESYNANPLSMKMAITSMQADPSAARRVLVLGDMRELGEEEVRYHRYLAVHIRELQPDCVLLCGNLMRHLWECLDSDTGLHSKRSWYEDARSLADSIDEWLMDGDRLLIKGSNAMGLGVLVKKLVG